MLLSNFSSPRCWAKRLKINQATNENFPRPSLIAAPIVASESRGLIRCTCCSNQVASTPCVGVLTLPGNDLFFLEVNAESGCVPWNHLTVHRNGHSG